MAKSSNRHIYGFHPVMEAIASGVDIEKIFLRVDLSPEKSSQVRRAAKPFDIPVQVVPEEKLRRVSNGAIHQGVAAIVSPVSFVELEELILEVQGREEIPLFVMLDGITDVRNLGAIARTAECMGAHGLILPTQGSAPVNADAVKTSAGALTYFPVAREKNLVDALLMFQAYGIQTVASTEKAGDLIFEVDFTGPTCLIMGSEDKGISNSILKRADRLVKIPIIGEIESLNVSVAAGMAMLEATRQRIEAA